MTSIHRILGTALVLAVALASAPARAQDAADAPAPEALEKAREAFMNGKKLFDEGKFREAALAFKESYKLSKNPILLYNIGFTIDKMNKVDLAIFYYEKFLEDAPENAPNRDLATERLELLKKQKADAEAAEKAAAEAAAKPPETAPAPTEEALDPEEVKDFQHNIILEAPPGKPIDVTAFVPKGAKWQVTMYYRTPGAASFTSVPMQQRYAEKVARIPAKATAKASSIQYYVEATAGEEIVARSGEPTSPHLITLDAAAKARFYPDFEDGGPSGPTEFSTSDEPSDKRSKYFWHKWGATGGAAAALILGVSFYALSADASSTLEGEAAASTISDACPDKPCRSFSKVQQDLQSRGKRFETLGHVSLGLTLAAAGAAGYFWWKDRDRSESDDKDDSTYNPDSDSPLSRVHVAPAIGGDFVGGAALIEF